MPVSRPQKAQTRVSADGRRQGHGDWLPPSNPCQRCSSTAAPPSWGLNTKYFTSKILQMSGPLPSSSSSHPLSPPPTNSLSAKITKRQNPCAGLQVVLYQMVTNSQASNHRNGLPSPLQRTGAHTPGAGRPAPPVGSGEGRPALGDSQRCRASCLHRRLPPAAPLSPLLLKTLVTSSEVHSDNPDQGHLKILKYFTCKDPFSKKVTFRGDLSPGGRCSLTAIFLGLAVPQLATNACFLKELQKHIISSFL